MEAEIESEFPQLDMAMLGVNQAGLDYGNETFTEGVDLPWLQDVDADGDGHFDVWTSWDVLPRDVVILDAQNRPVATYNLTTHDIADAENYATLKQLFVDIASAGQETGTINGHVYFDVNNDGQFDPVEAPIGGVTIELAGTTVSGDSVELTVQTQTDGSFSFQGLAAGVYTVRQQQPAMVLDGIDSIDAAATTGGVQVSANDEFTVELEVGEDVYGLGFGERGRTGSAITLADFLASTPKDGVEILTDAASVEWYCLRGEWQEFYYAEFAVEEPPASASEEAIPPVSMAFRNDHGHRLELEWPSSTSHLMPLATSHEGSLWRVHGELVDVTQLERDAANGEGENTEEDVWRAQPVEWPAAVDAWWFLAETQRRREDPRRSVVSRRDGGDAANVSRKDAKTQRGNEAGTKDV